MRTNAVDARRGDRPIPRGGLAGALLLLSLLLLPAAPALAVPPPAGTVISNQASATYTDGSAASYSATSNTVTTTVQQVASVTLAADGARTVTAGGTAYFPHTLTNTGNGADTFALAAADGNTGTIGFAAVEVYADGNGDGVADNFTPIATTGSLAAGATFRFVVGAAVPGTALDGQSETVAVTAASAFTPAVTASNTDTVTVTGAAVVTVTKSLSASSGPSPGAGQVTVTLTYTNTGNAAADNVFLLDTIGTGATAGMAYVAGSGAWSGGAPVTDAVGGDVAGLLYDWNFAGSGAVRAQVASVAPGATGTLSFRVSIAGSLPAGTASTSNTATWIYIDGKGTTMGPYTTNAASYAVDVQAGAVFNGSGSSSVNGTGEPVTVGSAYQGGTATFTNYVWNTGNAADTFDVAVTSDTFPAGTTFQLFQGDGTTPLADANGNGTGDTGNIAAASSFAVVVVATLPAGATGGPFDVTVGATSSNSGTVTDTVVDRLAAITAATVDLTYGTWRADGSPPGGGANGGNAATTGFGPGPEGSAVHSQAILPGGSSAFPFYVNNTSGLPDAYGLVGDQDTTFGGASDLPAGWGLEFRLDGGSGNCSTTGAVVASTGTVNDNANRLLCAVFTAPAGETAGNREFYLRSLSPTTSAADAIHLQLSVAAVRQLSFSPDRAGTVFAGAPAVFAHVLSNNGNVVEGDNAGSAVTLSYADNTAGWSTAAFYDANGNGALDNTDPAIPAGGIHLTPGAPALADGLAPGETAAILVRVTAPAGAAAGTVDLSTATATTANVSYVTAAPAAVLVRDTVTVVGGRLALAKEQALDAACDGTPDGPYGAGAITAGAVPGACVRYRITATNTGTADATSVVVTDAVPAFTTLDDGSRNSAGGACGTGPADAAPAVSAGSVTGTPACGATGSVVGTLGTLAPGASATMTFGVMIDI